jgi:hypothetical protein
MSENDPPPVWPPPRCRNKPPPMPWRNLSRAAVSPARDVPSPGPPSTPATIPQRPLTSATNKSKKSITYRNGYEVKPQTPSYKPYALNSRGRKRQRPFSFDDASEDPTIVPMQPLSQEQWSAEARSSCGLRGTRVLNRYYTIMSSLLTSTPSIPITGVFVDPTLSLALKVKVVNNQNEPTVIGTAVGLLQGRVAIQISDAFGLTAIHVCLGHGR